MLSAGFTQEIIFRGVMQRASVIVLGKGAGILYVAVLYSILHMGTMSMQIMLIALVTGLLYGAIVERTGSILGVSATQGIASIVALVYLPLDSIPAILG
jgi:membrane protease YdiL (CAAX protease family)